MGQSPESTECVVSTHFVLQLSVRDLVIIIMVP